jgi:hypothetical protein
LPSAGFQQLGAIIGSGNSNSREGSASKTAAFVAARGTTGEAGSLSISGEESLDVFDGIVSVFRCPIFRTISRSANESRKARKAQPRSERSDAR